MTYQADRPFTLYFVRHGMTEPNFRGFRCGGDLDLPMMDIGCDQAYLLAKQIDRMNLRIGVIIAGSLLRTRQTASIISGVLGDVPIVIEPLLERTQAGRVEQPAHRRDRGAARAAHDAARGRIGRQFRPAASPRPRPPAPLRGQRPLLVSSKGVGRVLNGLLGGQGRMRWATARSWSSRSHRTPAPPPFSVTRPHQA